MKKPICFIAMAFGRDDSDAVYQNSILPVLKRNNVTAIIINRQQSNDDLNFQIIEQLKQADFCIADLTYTRPSVYFEAGFAQRTIPVIYTVRKDHLSKGQPEDLRVHFDLQMKPIIDWRSATDSSFADRLERRLKATVLKDWKRNDKLRDQRESTIKTFNELSLLSRLRLLRSTTIYKLRQLGISLSSWGVERLNPDFYRYKVPKKLIFKGVENHVSGSVIHKKKLLTVSVQSYESVAKSELQRVEEFFGSVFYATHYLSSDDIHKLDAIFSNTVILSLKPLTAQQIEKVLAYYKPAERSKRYFFSRTMEPVEGHPIKVVIAFHFISGIESLPHLKHMLDDMIQGVEQLMQAQESL